MGGRLNGWFGEIRARLWESMARGAESNEVTVEPKVDAKYTYKSWGCVLKNRVC